MINYYQPFLWPFLRWQQTTVAAGIRQRYFLSFEDALWEVLPAHGVSPGSLILVPDFYCMDVVENIQSHGYQTAFYSLNDQFQIDEAAFKEKVEDLQPSVVFLFHAAGIHCQLVNQATVGWLHEHNCVVIEDCVHRLINPSRVQLFGEHHLVMDSLRKVSPLPGSMVYETDTSIVARPTVKIERVKSSSIPMQKKRAEFFYQYEAIVLFAVFKLTQAIAIAINSPQLMRFAHQVILKTHDNLIGDSRYGYAGWKLWQWLHSHFNFAKVEQLKQTQTQQYIQAVDHLIAEQSDRFYPITIAESDQSKLHVYPVGLRQSLTAQQINWLHQQGVVIWPKFSDSPWAMQRGVLFLPLGFHITATDINRTVTVLFQLFNHS